MPSGPKIGDQKLSESKTQQAAILSDKKGLPSMTELTAARPAFQDVTHSSEIRFSYSNGRQAGEFAIVESLGGGVGVFDYDADGLYEAMFAGGGELRNREVTGVRSALFRNLGGMRFRDETSACQINADRYFTHGVHPADFDGDGFEDLAISGYGGIQLYQNQGDGTFLELAPLKTNSINSWSSSLAWADLDNNGHLDLYVAHYVDWSWSKHPQCHGQGNVPREVCAPREFAGITDAIYFNDGAFPLRRAALDVGLLEGGKGLGVCIADLNGDEAVDIYVANDTTDNFLYLNDGTGHFKENAVLSCVSGDDAGVSTGSMGVSIFDFGGDQLPDIFVTNFERELSALYRNEGAGVFSFASRQAGFAAVEARFVGFGTVAIDYDYDGDQDILIANGHVSYQSPHSPYAQLPLAFENVDGNRYRRQNLPGYFATTHIGRGMAACDFNNDGGQDLAVSHLEGPVSLLQAVSPSSKKWATIRLVGISSNRSAIGATVTWTVNSIPRRHFVTGGGSYLSQCDRRIFLYWSDDDAVKHVRIKWPGRSAQDVIVHPYEENIAIEARTSGR